MYLIKKVEFQLVLWVSSSQILLAFPGPLLGQVSFKSYSSSKKIYYTYLTTQQQVVVGTLKKLSPWEIFVVSYSDSINSNW